MACVHIYQLRIDIKPFKANEFLKSMQSFSNNILEQKGCLSFTVYQDSGKQNTFGIATEWKTRRAMEDHFRTNEFQVLIGAARVLGEAFSMSLAKVLNTGGIELAGKLMKAQGKKAKRQTGAEGLGTHLTESTRKGIEDKNHREEPL